MGLDGGTIISRTDIIRGSSWRLASKDARSRSTRGGQVSENYVPEQDAAEAADIAAAKWSSCALTGEPLQLPIVADDLGKIYNKVNIVNFLLARKGVFSDDSARYRFENQLQFLEDFNHLLSRKSVFELDPSFDRDNESNSKETNLSVVDKWICPITGLHVGGTHEFVAFKKCGHSISLKAKKELNSDRCPVCDSTNAEAEVVLLNSSEEKVSELRKSLKRRLESEENQKEKRIKKSTRRTEK